MNIIKFDPRKTKPEQLKAILDACIKQSGTDPSEWIALPHDIILLQDTSIDHLVYIRDMLNKRIEELKEKGV